MAYSLTLTSSERKAIDWIGDRYAHGHNLHAALCACKWSDGIDWDADCDITFNMPEHVAWTINAIAEESDHRWDCFADSLVSKLEDFCAKIV